MTNADRFRETLIEAIAPWSLVLDRAQLDQLVMHYEAVVETNRTLNLTRVTDPVEAAVKLYADSLALLPWIAEADLTVTRIVDVGTGAGFPAFPLAVACPQWTVVALDARNKKVRFLAATAERCDVGNLHVAHSRAEEWTGAADFDIVTFKAVAVLAAGLEWSHRLPRTGGHVVAYKTPIICAAERDEAAVMAHQLDYAPVSLWNYELASPSETLRRALYSYCRRSG